MDKVNKPNTDSASISSDFIKFRPEVRFVIDENTIIIITPSGYKRLSSDWIIKLHERLCPLLTTGCFRNQLLNRVPQETKNAVNLYLRILEQSGAFINNKNLTSEQNFSHFSDLFPDLPKNSGALIEVDGQGKIVVICSRFDLLRRLKDLGANDLKRLITVLLLPDDFEMSASFGRVINWHLQSESFLSQRFGNILFFRWDAADLSCQLLFQKSLFEKLSFRDLTDSLSLISPIKTVSQLPLAILSLDTGKTPEIFASVNYKAAADGLMIREIVRQTAFIKNVPVSNQTADHFHISVSQTSAEFTVGFFSSASRTEIRAKILDFAAKKLFTSIPDKFGLDALALPSRIPATRYLQEVLRVKSSNLPVGKECFEGGFYRFSNEFCGSVSLSEEKALHDFLLRNVFAEYYPATELNGKNVRFYSGFSSFAAQRELKKMIECGEKLLKKNFAGFNLKINKVSTFWGDFYWGKQPDEAENFF